MPSRTGPAHPPMPLLRLSLAAALVATTGLALAGCGADGQGERSGGRSTNGRTSSAQETAIAKAAEVPAVAGGALSEGAVRLGLPSVVAVSVSSGGTTRTGTGTLLATGTVVTDGKLVTTAGGSPSAGVTVREGNGDEHPGVVDGIDPVSGLAALRVRDLTAVPVAKAAPGEVVLGAQVVGLGFLSARRPAMRPGSIVTTGRSIRLDGNAEVGLFEASASVGSQGLGGPIVDERGRVLGIATKTIASVVPGSVVAIPVAAAVRVARALAESGRVTRAYLGVDTVGVTSGRAEELRLTTSKGAMLRTIAPGSPASFSTLRAATGTADIGGRAIPTGGDIIVAIDRTRVDEPEDLDAALAGMRPGRRVTLKVVRGDTSADVRVTLGER